MSVLLHEKKFPEGIFQVYSDKPSFKTIHGLQTHSNIILKTSDLNLAQDTITDGLILQSDEGPSDPMAIQTADCLPILLIGDNSVLLHAGWKGLANGIIDDSLLQKLNIHTVYIGPSIKEYEVQEGFHHNFPKSDHFYTLHGKLYFNLQAEAQDQLESCFPGVKVYNSNICTLTNTSYNSYRRNKTKQRNWNIYNYN